MTLNASSVSAETNAIASKRSAEATKSAGSVAPLSQPLHTQPREVGAYRTPQLVFRRVWRSELPSIVLFFALSVAAILMTREMPWSLVSGSLITVGGTRLILHLPIFFLVPFCIICLAAVRIYDARYQMDEKGIESRVGILGFTLKVVRISFEDIREIEVNQRIYQRFLNTGEVDIYTAATGHAEISMTGIDDPQRIQRILTTERDRRVRRHPSQNA